MITDPVGRFALTQLDATTLWRYDRRWRTGTTIEPFAGASFTSIEGRNHLALISQPEPGGEITVNIISPQNVNEILATGTFVDTWAFEGSPSMWSEVPEYFLMRQKDGRPGLLRIADDTEVDELDGFESASSVAQVPNSRLVVIGGKASYTVYDPVALRSIRHFELAGGNPTPVIQFKNGEEMWINDFDTMLKVETKEFKVIDAAGSDIASNTDSGKQGMVGSWNFAAANELCVMTRPNVGDVLVLDTVSMLPVARAVFGRWHPMEAVLLGRNSIVAVDPTGRALRARLRKIAIHFKD